DGNSKTLELVWTEGFANGIGNILDTYMRWEFGFPGREHDRGNTAHRNPQPVGNRSLPLTRDQTVTHGFASEHYIGFFVYDLWDGAANLMAGNNPGLVRPADHEDAGPLFDVLLFPPNHFLDTISLSFAEICGFLQQNAYIDANTLPRERFGQDAYLINHIGDFFQEVLEHVGTPEARAGIKRLSEMNLLRIVRFTPRPTFPTDRNELNSDAIFYSGPVSFPRWKRVSITVDNSAGTDPLLPTRVVDTHLFKARGTAFYDNILMDVVQLPTVGDDFHLGAPAPVAFADTALTDSLRVGGEGEPVRLKVNEFGRLGWQRVGNSFGMPRGTASTARRSDFRLDVIGDTELEVVDGGMLVLGDSVEENTATVHIREGATFTLGGPGSAGTLVINNHSELVIDSGANFNFLDGGAIYLNGNDAVLRIEGNWFIEGGAEFTFTGHGHIHTNLPVDSMVNMEPGSAIALRGRDKVEDLILVVEGGSELALPADCSLAFELNNGKSELGAGASINIRQAELVLDAALLTKDSKSGGLHAGLHFQGNQHTIRDSDITHGLEGLVVDLDTVTGCQTEVLRTTNLKALANGQAVRCLGGSFSVQGGEFSENDQGMLHQNATASSELMGVTGKGNITFLRVTGTNPQNSRRLTLGASRLDGGDTCIHVLDSIRLIMACDSIGDYSCGIALGQGAQVNMERGARNEFDVRDVAIHLEESFAPLLRGGLNSWISGGNFFTGTVFIQRAQNGTPSPPLDATSNHWEGLAPIPAARINVADQFGQPVLFTGATMPTFVPCGN
ncbi:MAG: hypothetical protein AAGB22_02730, partial [Bacteroidota bacterium]